MSGPAAVERARAAFATRHGTEPEIVVRAPGRVNLIGEHTDYNDGFAMPMALQFDVAIAATPGPDAAIEVASEGFDPATIDLRRAADPASGWAAFVHGIAQVLHETAHPIRGWHGCIASDIPAGASLSSSAALTMAAGLTTMAAAGQTIDAVELALLGQRVENDVLGMPCGNLDQLASVSGRAGAAILIDCRSLDITTVDLPSAASVVIMDTGTRRRLVDSEFAKRRASSEEAARQLQVAALRDATFDLVRTLDDPLLRRRATHVVGENERTLAAADACRADDAPRLGELMNESHRSLHEDYEVTGPATDAIVRVAQTVPGCYGARMTGGGFAGGALALVDRSAVNSFIAEMTERYHGIPDQPASAPVSYWPAVASPGAEVLVGPS